MHHQHKDYHIGQTNPDEQADPEAADEWRSRLRRTLRSVVVSPRGAATVTRGGADDSTACTFDILHSISPIVSERGGSRVKGRLRPREGGKRAQTSGVDRERRCLPSGDSGFPKTILQNINNAGAEGRGNNSFKSR